MHLNALTSMRMYTVAYSVCVYYLKDTAAIAIGHIFYEATLFALESCKAIAVRTTKCACRCKDYIFGA